MSDISTNQNLKHNIDLLVAQRFFYSKAKKIRNIRIVISISVALMSPIVVYFMTDYVSIIGTIGGLWALIAYLLKKLLENINIEKAAKIQEEFDTNIFNIPWNTILVGDKIPHEDINYGKKRFKGDLTKLKDWYGDISEFPYPLDVLLCQRSNLVWDWRLKKAYAVVIFVILIIYFVASIIFSSIIELKLAEYVLGLFIPALSGYLMGIDEATEHFKASKKREKLEKKINKLSETALNNVTMLKTEDLRQIQNCIFEFRKEHMVADCFYCFFRDQFENNMTQALKEFRRKLRN